MTSKIENVLIAESAQLADGYYQRSTALEKEKLDLQSKLLATNTSLKVFSGREERATSFFKELRSGLICPRCWIQEKVRASVEAKEGGTRTEDFFRCSNGHEFSVELDD